MKYLSHLLLCLLVSFFTINKTSAQPPEKTATQTEYDQDKIKSRSEKSHKKADKINRKNDKVIVKSEKKADKERKEKLSGKKKKEEEHKFSF